MLFYNLPYLYLNPTFCEIRHDRTDSIMTLDIEKQPQVIIEWDSIPGFEYFRYRFFSFPLDRTTGFCMRLQKNVFWNYRFRCKFPVLLKIDR